MTVSLTNTSNRCQVFVLAHETYCKALGECACDVEQGRAPRRTPRSLTLATGVTSPALDDAVLAVPDVVRAVRRGELAVKRHVAEPSRAAAADAAASPFPPAPPGASRPAVSAPPPPTNLRRCMPRPRGEWGAQVAGFGHSAVTGTPSHPVVSGSSRGEWVIPW